MKFEQNAVAQYLVNNLKSLTAADPNILADYVVALLKNDVPAGELQKLCADRLEAFLGNSSMSFTAKLFEALQEGSLQSSNSNLDVMKSSEAPMSNSAVETLDLKSLLPNEDSQSTSSEQLSDLGERENSDDDDRNHKHRRRDASGNSFDTDVQEQFVRRPVRKRSKDHDSGQLYMETRFQSRETQKECNSSIDREAPSRSEKRHFSIPASLRPSSDLSSRSRLSTSIRTDPGPRLDLFNSIGRPSLGRGRGRNLATWNQYDSRFNSLDTLDFTSQMTSQRPFHPTLFVGPGLQGAGTSQNASWGSFGFIHGMSNGIMDPLHPLGLQTTLRPTLNPMNISMPRQRCRDFEERGFCLRGDMCPMEHGVNRIVVEDVQSLSQFNLPVSIPNSHALGVQSGAGSLHRGPTSSALIANKNMHPKNSKSAASEDGLRLNCSTSTVGGEADVYDPDQPLWNNSTDTSAALLRLPSPNTEDESLWDGKISCKSSRLSDGNDGDLHRKNLTANVAPQGAGSSVWGRIGSGSKSETEVKLENNNSSTGQLVKEMGNSQGVTVSSSFPSDHSKLVISEFGPKVETTQPISIRRNDFMQKSERMQQKAFRTLFVLGIPPKNNRMEPLYQHFQRFGQVIDIHIPVDSDRAFVQFCKREEAEEALNSPDAVMGNRFIKLFWANRDRILDDGKHCGGTNALQCPRVVSNSVQLLHPVEIEKKHLSMEVQRKINTKSVELSVPSVGPSKNVIMNGPKALTSPTKKLENLELLEELRRKQELLAQKRDEFRRQLVKFEKQASIKKSDGALEQAAKRNKIDTGRGLAKNADSGPATISNLGICQDREKTLEKSNLAEILVSPNSKAYPGTMQQSVQFVKQATPLLTPYPNRFKLDNRPTSFRVLPPLPAKLANVAVLKDHFSKFGDLASVSFENKEESDNSALKEPEKKAAIVTFHTRHSAEKAYQAGKCWDGCNLKFVWATSSSVALKDRRGHELPSNSFASTSVDEDKAGLVKTSSSNIGEPISRRLFDIASKQPEAHDIEGTNCTSIASNSLIEPMESSPSIVIHESENNDANKPTNNGSANAGDER